jgi:hypothetical protein
MFQPIPYKHIPTYQTFREERALRPLPVKRGPDHDRGKGDELRKMPVARQDGGTYQSRSLAIVSKNAKLTSEDTRYNRIALFGVGETDAGPYLFCACSRAMQ